jgi:hypothetical protein
VVLQSTTSDAFSNNSWGAVKGGIVDTSYTSLNANARRVVVTGMGITSCLGNTLEEVEDSLKECKTGIEFDEEFKELGIKSQVRGKPKLSDADFKELIPKQYLRFMGTNAKVRTSLNYTYRIRQYVPTSLMHYIKLSSMRTLPWIEQFKIRVLRWRSMKVTLAVLVYWVRWVYSILYTN